MMILNTLTHYAILLMLLTVCYTDIRYRIITNIQVMIIFFIILINFIFAKGSFSITSASIFFITGLFLFYFNLVGAGDIKLITVLLLSIANSATLDFFIIMALFGFILALIAIVKRLITRQKTTIPYGVAISFSYLIMTI